jgi:ABC-type nitrate/sulfonate/bicarbonate transport system permease component
MNTPAYHAVGGAIGVGPYVPGNFEAYRRGKRRRLMVRRTFRAAVGLAAVLTVWELLSRYYGLELILPTPWAVIKTVAATLAIEDPNWLYGPNVYVHLAHSFARAMTGFALAAILAIPMALVIGRVTAAREFVMPILSALYPIPGIAWIPLAILWFGLGDKAVVFVVFTTSFFPLFFSTEAGARHINPTLLDAGRCFGARGSRLFFRVILPATIPYIITGLRISLGTAWRMIVAGEMLASQDGIGYLLVESRFQFRATDLMMAMIVVSIVGYLTEKLLVGTIERHTIEKWEVQPT